MLMAVQFFAKTPVQFFDYEAVQKWSLEGHFVKALQVSHQFGVDRDAMPHILCAKNWQANMIRTFACYKPMQGAGTLPNAILLRPLYVDMTYDLSECFVTVFVMAHPYFIDERIGKEPFVPVAFFVSHRREKSDYIEAAKLLEKALNLPEGYSAFGLVTDDESALHGGLKTNKLIEDGPCTHVLCELHLKKNCELKLTHLRASKEVCEKVLHEIFGSEEQVE